MDITIHPEDPRGPDLDLLFQRHAAAMQADTPPESIHMIPREGLVTPDLTFLVARDKDAPVAMGALKRLAGDEGEIKSMHVLSEHRGRGLSRLMLAALIEQARAGGLRRLSLETGAQPSFAAARGLYASAGFSDCPPFGSYRADPNSHFMTLELA